MLSGEFLNNFKPSLLFLFCSFFCVSANISTEPIYPSNSRNLEPESHSVTPTHVYKSTDQDTTRNDPEDIDKLV